jgi:hypothetical protein
MTAAAEIRYCRTCRRALNQHTTPTGQVTYRHAEHRASVADHPPAPVPLAEIPDPIIECDYCSRPDAAFVYVCGDQDTRADRVTGRVVSARDYQRRHHAARTLRTHTAPGLTQSWGQRWSACHGCAALIDARDLLGLIARVIDTMPARFTRRSRLARTRAHLHTTYTTVFATLQPGRGRITPDHPLGAWEPPEDTTP